MGAIELLGDRYALRGVVGSGGMADVYRATDTRLLRDVAIKLFHGKADARLESEARTLAALSHPGVVRLFDVDTDGRRPYLVMQLIDGTTLRESMNAGPIPPERVASLGARLADTLAYVHSRHVTHRDVKPANVLLNADDDPYLVDFGIAHTTGDPHLTATGQCLGTAAYLAPEQVRDESPGAQADVYSLGLLLLECLTGTTEYGGTDIEAAIARLTRPPRVPDQLSPAWRTALIAMTTTDPAHRPTAAEAAALLRDAARHPGDSHAAYEPSPPRPGETAPLLIHDAA